MNGSTDRESWQPWNPPAGWKHTGGGEWHGPCPITGAGKDTCWVNPDKQFIGCRKCSYDGSGGLDKEQYKAHGLALGVLIDLGAATKKTVLDTWTWTTADGTKREQYRYQFHDKDKPEKRWEVTVPRNTPKPRDLLYVPDPSALTAEVVYLCEGASDTDAMIARGLPAIGRPGAAPSRESLARLRADADMRIFPDHDDDNAGYKQARTWQERLKERGIVARIIDPRKLWGREPESGTDARDFLNALPNEPVEGLRGRLDAAVVDVISGWAPRTKQNEKPALASGSAVTPASGSAVTPDDIENQADSGDLWQNTDRAKDFAYRAGHGWMVWKSDTGWMVDRTEAIINALMDFGRIAGSKTYHGNKSYATGVATYLKTPCLREGWDGDPFILGTHDNQVVDLRTGSPRPAERDDLITRRTAAMSSDDEGEPGRWDSFLKETLPADSHDWIQRVIGYAATGLTREHLLLFIYGEGGTGKGTFLTAIADILGDYARRIDADDLMENHGEQHPAWLADLEGKRLVIADEIPRGRRWATARTKGLVSAEPQRARKMRQDFFEFRPVAQVILAANHAPELISRDTGMMRRLRVIGFKHKPAVADTKLPEKILPSEVLAWIVAGAKRYLADGLGDLPPSVRAETEQYHANADPVSRFVAEHWPKGEERPRADLHTEYRNWAATEGIDKPLNRARFLATLREDFRCHERKLRGVWMMRGALGALGASSSGSVSRDAHTRARTSGHETQPAQPAPNAPNAPNAPAVYEPPVSTIDALIALSRADPAIVRAYRWGAEVRAAEEARIARGESVLWDLPEQSKARRWLLSPDKEKHTWAYRWIIAEESNMTAEERERFMNEPIPQVKDMHPAAKRDD